jgi:hypothetical protein
LVARDDAERQTTGTCGQLDAVPGGGIAADGRIALRNNRGVVKLILTSDPGRESSGICINR